MSKNSDEPVPEPKRILSNADWEKFLQALKAIAKGEKEEQKRFREEKKIWRTEKWLLIANLVISSIQLIIGIARLVKK